MKDLRLEIRSRYALNVLLMFVLSAVLIVAFSIGTEVISIRTQAALLWVVISFAASLGLGRSFIAEEERGTTLLLRLHVRSSHVYAGKLLFNIALIGMVNGVALLVFSFLLGMRVEDPTLVGLTLVLGAIALAGATTLLSAIVARASASSSLLPVLLLPLLIPLLLSVVRATQNSFTPDLPLAQSAEHLVVLVAFSGVVITASSLLFEYVWND